MLGLNKIRNAAETTYAYSLAAVAVTAYAVAAATMGVVNSVKQNVMDLGEATQAKVEERRDMKGARPKAGRKSRATGSKHRSSGQRRRSQRRRRRVV